MVKSRYPAIRNRPAREGFWTYVDDNMRYSIERFFLSLDNVTACLERAKRVDVPGAMCGVHSGLWQRHYKYRGPLSPHERFQRAPSWRIWNLENNKTHPALYVVCIRVFASHTLHVSPSIHRGPLCRLATREQLSVLHKLRLMKYCSPKYLRTGGAYLRRPST